MQTRIWGCSTEKKLLVTIQQAREGPHPQYHSGGEESGLVVLSYGAQGTLTEQSLAYRGEAWEGG